MVQWYQWYGEREEERKRRREEEKIKGDKRGI
jgi:hypothetical protein